MPDDLLEPIAEKPYGRWDDQPMVPSQCSLCLHRNPDNTCGAFGGRPIPLQILTNQVDHRKPFPGDHGVHWEPISADVTHPRELFK